MATKVTSHVIADNAVTDAKLHSDFTATTQSASDNSTNVATTAYVTTAIANLSDSAPSTLNTLNELAAALGDDANFSTTVTNSIAAKAPLASPTFSGIVSLSNRAKTIDGSAQMNIGQWDGTNHRIEADSNRKFVITSYHTDGIHLGGSGNSHMVIKGGKVLVGDTASHTDDLFQIETPASGGGHGIQIRRNDSNSDQGIGRIMFGNNTDTDLATIQATTDGATDNARLTFHTQPDSGSSTERMRINHDGKVGIGKTPSTWHLDVDSSDGYIASFDGSNNTGIAINSSSGIGDIIGYSNSASSYNKVNIRGASGTGLVVDTSNNVGIGTDSPIATFHVETSTNSPGLFKSTYSGGGYIEYKLGASGANLGYLGSASQLISGGSATQLGIRSQGDVSIATGGNTERFRIESSGHIHGQILSNSNSNPLGSGTNSGKLWSTSGNWINVWYVGNDPYGIRYFYELDIQGLFGYTSYGEIYKDRSGRWHVLKHRSAGTDIQVEGTNNYIQVNQNSGANQTNSAGNFTLVRAPGTT